VDAAGTHQVIVPDPAGLVCYSGSLRPRMAKARGSPVKW
jgi:hypothetical protein